MSINIFIEVLPKSIQFIIGSSIYNMPVLCSWKIIAASSRINVKSMECQVISNLVSNEEIEIFRFLIL